ncbi:MAG: hypothetical protein Fues2KO_10440 [Fuerstiella sp.]
MSASKSLVDGNLVSSAAEAVDFISNILESSTEYSIVGKDLDGRIVLWNEGARRLYGYEPEEVVGKADSAILYSHRDRQEGRPKEILTSALENGKWEGTVQRRRKNGHEFTARVVITPRRDSEGQPIGFLLISKDISDEMRLTDELKETQFYTRSLIESNIDALMTTNPLGIITDVNEQMQSLTGCSREELIGSPFKQYFTDPTRAEEGIKQVLQEGRVTNYELTARTKDGRHTVVSYNASTFSDASGRLQGVFAAARDITEQRKLENQLRESESYNRGLIEASVDGLITVDPKGAISDVNEQMARMSGYSREELIGTPFADYFVDPQRATAGVTQTFDEGVVTNYELTLSTRDERQLRVSFNASIFKNADGEVRGIFASARDITEQSELQTLLLEERAYNRGLIEASLDGLVTVDPMRTITDVNETMCRMSGYTREELIGTEFQSYFTDTTDATLGVQKTFDEGAVTNYQLTLKTKQGREMMVSFNAAIFRDESGQVRGIFASARDITEQSQLQQQLAEEQAYNRGLIEASVDGLVTVDESMTITDVNETMCRMVGRSRNQLIGSSFPDYFAERDEAAEGVKLTFTEGAVTNYVLTLETAEGGHLPVSFNAAVFKDTAGNVRGIFASARDITEQKKLDHQLREQQFYTRSLIESNIDALMTTDPLGKITDVNQQMEALTGCTREELIGSPFKNYFTDPLRAEKGIQLVLHRGKVTNYELTARSKSGQETVVSYNATTFKDADGNLEGVFAAAREVTEQKTLEEQLREQQTYLRGLIESSVDGLITVDPDGVITDINDKMCEMTGYTRAELIGTPFADYFTEPDRARAGVEQTFDMEFVTEYALTLVSRGRRLLHVSFNASIFKDRNDNVRGIFASARDITDRVRLEEQMREQQTYLRGLIESSVDGLITVDPEGYITDVNEQMCRMTDYDRDELIGSQFKRYFIDPDLADKGVKRTFAEAVVTNYELVLQTKGGRKSNVSFNASIFRDAESRIQGIFASARDIHEQSRLQQQLAEEQAYTRSLIEASADALFAIGPDGVITDVNAASTRLTGYTQKHLINSAFSDYFTEPERASAGVKQTFDEGRVISYELVLTTRHGRRITVSFNAGVFNDAAGKPQGILAAARDITEQKRLDQQLRDQQFYTRSLIESNVDALMTTDPLGIITDVNQQMESLTGCTRDDLIGSPFKEYFTNPERAEQGIQLVLQENEVTNYELTARGRDGRETVVSYNAVTFNDRDGKLQGVFAAARDITETKQASQYARSLIESSLDPLVTISTDGKITDVNDATIKVTGVPRENLIGTDFSSYFTEPDKASEGYREVFEKGTVTDYALTIRSTTGKLTDVLYNAAVYKDDKGEVLGVFAAARDVTERKRFEQTLQEKNGELEKASMAKDRFLANMSHEIRTPMNAIIGLTDLVLATELDSVQADYLSTVAESAGSLLQVINDILDFSKIEVGKLELESTDFEIRELVGDMLRSLALKAHRHGLELTYRVDPAVPEMLVGDPGRLRQVLMNLVGNAVKFTEKGQVIIEVQSGRSPDPVSGPAMAMSYLHFSVRDTGIGIAADKLDTIFEEFEQADTSSSRKYGGTGLGLAITSRLVQRMGGRIWVESEPGVGSTFHFTVQMGISEERPCQPWQDAVAQLQKQSVLIVDDNPTNQVVLKEMCESRQLTVQLADSGEQALELLRSSHAAGCPIDVMVTDVNMPGQDGYELTEAIRKDSELQGLSIVILASSGDLGDAARCKHLGVTERLLKPVKHSELFAAMVRAMGIARPVENDQSRDATAAGITLETSATHPLDILLAEDSLANQKLALALLEADGHRVCVADNGKQAVDAVSERSFDVVLMDVQMPGMDGFTATAEIRRREAETGGYQPIVALTAHALKEDRDRCLNAGMDEYVSKPIDRQKLMSAIDAAIRKSQIPEAELDLGPDSACKDDNDAVRLPNIQRIPWDKLLEVVAGRQQLLDDLIDIYFKEMQQSHAAVRNDIEQNNKDGLRRSAHALKNTLRYFKCADTVQIAERLERVGESDSSETLQDDVSLLSEHIAAISSDIRTYRKQIRKPPHFTTHVDSTDSAVSSSASGLRSVSQPEQ